MKSMIALRTLGTLVGLVMLGGSVGHTQTTLSAGDIAFTMFNSTGGGSNASRFSFVTLVDLSVGTTISFTDIGWNGTGFRATIGASSNETSITYTTTTTVTKGTQITIGYTSGTSTLAATATGGSVAFSSGSQSNINFTSPGDQILAYQGTFGSGAIFVAGINTDTTNLSATTGWSSNTSPTLPESQLPSTLSAGGNAISLSVSGNPGSYTAIGTDTANAQLNFSALSPTTARTASEWLAVINNYSNWSITTTATSSFTDSTQSLAISAIPEPNTYSAIVSCAILGFAVFGRSRRNSKILR